MLALFIAQALAVALPQDVPTELSDVVVEGVRPTILVTVSVTGDIPPEVIVRSDPIGVRCGATRFRYESYASPRICWARLHRQEVISLTAEGLDRLGAGWVVDWEGCEPLPGSIQCNLVTPDHEALVTAHIHRG